MKISVDKNLTTFAQAAQVKEDIKEFKERYTDGDLKSVFCDTFGFYPAYSSEIVYVTGHAFPGGSEYGNATHFSIDVLATNNKETMLGFCRMHFYCDMELNIDTREYPIQMWDCEIYEPRK